jgi:hypothetical protein
MIPFGVTLPATVPQGSEILEGLMNNSVYKICLNGFHICGSVHHQSILLNNQRDAALSSRIYSSLRDYMFRVLSALIIRSTIKTVDAIIGTVHVSVWCRLNPLKDVHTDT